MKPEQEKRFEDFLRSNREAFHVEQPDDAMLERIQVRMRTIDKQPAKGIFRSIRFVRLAAACLLFAIAVTSIWLLQRKNADDPNAVLLTGLTDSSSAATRINNISSIVSLQNPDTSIFGVLFGILEQDPNTNVRLAALETLSHFYGSANIKARLISELKSQRDPFVTISLIQLFTDKKELSILEELDRIVVDLSIIKEVRSQAYTSIFLIRS